MKDHHCLALLALLALPGLAFAEDAPNGETGPQKVVIELDVAPPRGQVFCRLAKEPDKTKEEDPAEDDAKGSVTKKTPVTLVELTTDEDPYRPSATVILDPGEWSALCGFGPRLKFDEWGPKKELPEEKKSKDPESGAPKDPGSDDRSPYTPKPVTIGENTTLQTLYRFDGSGDSRIKDNPALKDHFSAPTVTISAPVLPSLDEASERLHIAAAEPGTGHSGTPISDPVAASAQLLAEVIFEQAQAGAYGSLSDRLERLLCDKLVAGAKTAKANEALGLQDGDLLFPQSCNAARTHGLPELLESPELLTDAVSLDLAALAASAVAAQATKAGITENDKRLAAHVDETLQALTPLVLARVGSDQPLRRKDARVMLRLLTKQQWTEEIEGEMPGLVDCTIGLTLAVAGTCAKGDCTPEEVVDMVENPKDHFTLGDTCEGELIVGGKLADAARKHRAELAAIALDVIDVVDPDTDDADAIKVGVDVPFDLMALGLAIGRELNEATCTKKEDPPPSTGADGEEIDPATVRSAACETAAEMERLEALVTPARRLVRALVDDDGSEAAAHGAVLIGQIAESVDCKPESGSDGKKTPCKTLVRKVGQAVPIASVLVAAADVPDPDDEASEEDEDKQRDSRKDALKAAIAAATSRQHRAGDTVFSLGSAVGFGAHVNVLESPTNDDGAATGTTTNGTNGNGGGNGGNSGFAFDRSNLTLPLGVGMQTLAPAGTGAGLHLALYPVDLAELLDKDLGKDENGDAIDPIYWHDITEFGFQIGPTLNLGPRNTFVLALDARHDPMGDDRAETRVGLTLAYYVPVFDLN